MGGRALVVVSGCLIPRSASSLFLPAVKDPHSGQVCGFEHGVAADAGRTAPAAEALRRASAVGEPGHCTSAANHDGNETAARDGGGGGAAHGLHNGPLPAGNHGAQVWERRVAGMSVRVCCTPCAQRHTGDAACVSVCLCMSLDAWQPRLPHHCPFHQERIEALNQLVERLTAGDGLAGPGPLDARSAQRRAIAEAVTRVAHPSPSAAAPPTALAGDGVAPGVGAPGMPPQQLLQWACYGAGPSSA